MPSPDPSGEPASASPALGAGRRIPPPRGLLWLIFGANAAVLTATAVLLIALPVTVSSPVTASEAGIIAAGLVLTLAVNLLVTRRLLRPLARLRAAMLSVDPLRPGQRISLDAGSIEVAELTRAFNLMLERIEAERRGSARRTQAAEEAQRRALSLELHDQVGQNLTALLLQLDVASRSADPRQLAALEASVATARETLDQVRSIVRGLRPEALDDLGLARAVRSLCDRVSGDETLRVDCRIDPQLPRLTPDAELVVYRVTQESLTNILRHSGTHEAIVELRPAGGGVTLTVRDAGTGFAPDADEGSGIRGMRERALLIGARLKMTPASPGTEVRLEVPPAEVRA